MRNKMGLLSLFLFLLFMCFSHSQSIAGLNPMIIEPVETGIAGSASNFMVTNATPNFPTSAGGVEYYFSFNAGSAPSNSAWCTGTNLDLTNPRFLGRRPTNSDGNASFVANVPASLEGVTVHVQAIDTGNCQTTQAISLTFEPPIQEFDLFLNPLMPGQAGKFNVFSTNFATPGGLVKYIWGLVPGAANGNALCPGLTTDIQDFREIGTLPVDDFGNTLGGFYVPPGAAGLTIYVQGIDLDTCEKSNVLEHTF